ncbi:putative zinc-binding peptidase [Luteolibacter pohnpeiensis]|uniref:Zinc-binding peptidase n=1 Tax=Luteolibacter pohnpeiensis TaxID=454153 RepID=A0A934VU86_9BACT|nr:putative zinc-binding peptidase [Luteolibacter pohnpeiensis]MBK1880865.1 putative zinc-binding peptidase [Luteolibacter pohnpeiensis]
MKNFHCQKCGERLFFENTLCLSCSSALGFLPDFTELAVIEPAGDQEFSTLAKGAEDRLYRKCANYQLENACNWMVPADETDGFCCACRLNRIIPDLSGLENRKLWVKMEAAKRRLIYGLLRLELPIVPKSVDLQNGLAFEFLADQPTTMEQPDQVARILTGHADGVITINLAEADDAVREKTRMNMGEAYRTLLGHFRHESAHYYWDRLVRNDPGIDQVRAIFGDERSNYQLALQNYYQTGAPIGWESSFVTPYAASHPWEDWAETWAHYLHIMATLETASAAGLQIRNRAQNRVLASPFGRNFSEIREDWHALRFVVNSLNRSMGMADPYPFILSDAITEKLSFIHHWIRKDREVAQLVG